MPISLWDHAVAMYRRDDVAAACLALQEQAGADINLLLTASWLAHCGRAWRREEVVGLIRHCAGWREGCVLPLRAARRHVGAGPGGRDDEFYQALLGLELDAERRQLALIADRLAPAPDGDGSEAANLTQRNLETYLQVLAGEGIAADGQRLLQALRRPGI